MIKKRICLSLHLSLFAFILFISSSYSADCEKARTYFRQALELSEDLPSLIKKEQLYQKAIELCPSYSEAHNNLGDTYEKQGRFEEAVAEYKKAIELKPLASHPYFGIGDVYYKTNRPKEAIQWYEEGLKYDPNDKLTRERLTLLRNMQKGDVIKAETIKRMFFSTRGVGDVVSITFGEGLIPFDFDKYDIRSDAEPQLNEIGKALSDLLTKGQEIFVEIAGHTDIRGTDQYNLALSRRRSESVVNYLVKNFNIPRENLTPNGYGKRVNLCTTDTSEGCHALNRRVEIIKRDSVKEDGTRAAKTHKDKIDTQQVTMDLGIFYQISGLESIKILKEDSRLRSRSDRYFFFLRPLQDCYVYILQEDSDGNINLLFPRKGDYANVKADKDYWVPSFGKSFTLDDTKGEEKIYLLATSWSLESAIEGLSLKDQVRSAIKGLQTRIIKVVRPTDASQAITSEELKERPQRVEGLLERVEGEGGWVKVIKFWHE